MRRAVRDRAHPVGDCGWGNDEGSVERQDSLFADAVAETYASYRDYPLRPLCL